MFLTKISFFYGNKHLRNEYHDFNLTYKNIALSFYYIWPITLGAGVPWLTRAQSNFGAPFRFCETKKKKIIQTVT